MKKYLFIYLLFIITLCSCDLNTKYIINSDGNFIKETEFIDSITKNINDDYAWKLDSIYSEYNRQLDTVEELRLQVAYYRYTIDSLEEELFVSNYKLERIAEYNRIAAKGNNITFLRGWINRVLND